MCDFWEEMSTVKKFGIILIGIVVIVSCFLIGFSVTVMGPLYYGLEYDKNSVSVDSGTLHESGRHFQGLGFSFIEFPRTQQILIFSDTIREEKQDKDGADFKEQAKQYSTISVRTSEGLKIYIDVFIGYKMTTSSNEDTKASQLWDIYTKFGENWNDFIALVVMSVLRDEFMLYDALKIPESREQIGADLESTLKNKLEPYHFDVVMVNIVNVQFPSLLDSAITETEIVAQQLEAKEFQIKVAEIEQKTAISLAKKDGEIILDNAKTDGEVKYILDKGYADTQIDTIKSYSESMRIIEQQLGFSEAQVLDFLWVYALNNNNAAKVVVGTDQPVNSP